jgi:hypothetical protein
VIDTVMPGSTAHERDDYFDVGSNDDCAVSSQLDLDAVARRVPNAPISDLAQAHRFRLELRRELPSLPSLG